MPKLLTRGAVTPKLTSLKHHGARWQNGDVEDCKSSNASSILARASIFPLFSVFTRSKRCLTCPPYLGKTKAFYSYLFLGSSVVEQATVNRLVAGSNPARGAIFQTTSFRLLVVLHLSYFQLIKFHCCCVIAAECFEHIHIGQNVFDARLGCFFLAAVHQKNIASAI